MTQPDLSCLVASMGKLRLKRTPAEEAEHRARKRRRKDLKKEDVDAEARFQESMSMAFEDDERVDSLESRFNGYHDPDIPTHWGDSSSRRRRHFEDPDDYLKQDPSTMDEEEYAEWIRFGMYRCVSKFPVCARFYSGTRRSHKDEYEEEKRQKAAEKSAKRREQAIKEAAKKQESERRKRRRERESRKQDSARDDYEARWKTILAATQLPDTQYRFEDIPWPIYHSSSRVITVDDLNSEAILTFLSLSKTVDTEEEKRVRKDKLRETYLRFHPDKFEGRLMNKVDDEYKDIVRLGVGQVVRILNDLMQK
ncbi:hypothetical protein CYLTODRAFT_226423 [Cylindrobasidium torrendii FP15055 ss-10]|uniref:J domain-containing protein n=1 Tax=Cylindrobasidium torrendii FP15055 ss-10 TaxID=1314674 RepID=A0A0D7BH78_9AGAR|nr:hypothetical protein CYLTODRAFT_226423 [Cylindrobasidium torrendii FP15055 ss-10]